MIYSDFVECETCLGDDDRCFSCDGTGGDVHDFQECQWCGGPAEVMGKPDDEPKCDQCCWEEA